MDKKIIQNNPIEKSSKKRFFSNEKNKYVLLGLSVGLLFGFLLARITVNEDGYADGFAAATKQYSEVNKSTAEVSEQSGDEADAITDEVEVIDVIEVDGTDRSAEQEAQEEEENAELDPVYKLGDVMKQEYAYASPNSFSRHTFTVSKIARDIKVDGVVDNKYIAFYVTLGNNSINNGKPQRETYSAYNFRLQTDTGSILSPATTGVEGEITKSEDALASGYSRDYVVVFDAAKVTSGIFTWNPESVGRDMDFPFDLNN